MAENKGLKSIFSASVKSDFDAINQTSSTLQNAKKIPVKLISPNPRQPRLMFDKSELEKLASSIKSLGLLNPIGVTESEKGYILTQGERRFRAIQSLGWTSVPAIIEEDKSDLKKARAGLAENVIRVNLTPKEEAKAFQQLIEKNNWTQEQIANDTGISRSAVANKLRLLNLPAEVQVLIAEGKLKEGHARQLLSLSNPKEIIDRAKLIIQNNITVRDLESSKKGTPVKKTINNFNVVIKKDVLKNNRFNSLVKKNNNKLSFTFNTEEEMQKFLDYLGFGK